MVQLEKPRPLECIGTRADELFLAERDEMLSLDAVAGIYFGHGHRNDFSEEQERNEDSDSADRGGIARGRFGSGVLRANSVCLAAHGAARSGVCGDCLWLGAAARRVEVFALGATRAAWKRQLQFVFAARHDYGDVFFWELGFAAYRSGR